MPIKQRKRGIVLWNRESTEDKKENLEHWERVLHREAERLDAPILKTFACVETGQLDNRLTFLRAIDFARKHDAVLVAFSRDRFVRSRCFGVKMTNKTEEPTDFDYRELMEIANGCSLATVIDPDLPPGVVKSIQNRRIRGVKLRYGGRPPRQTPGWKKRLRDRRKPRAIKLREDGKSYSEIARTLTTPRSTVYDWINK